MTRNTLQAGCAVAVLCVALWTPGAQAKPSYDADPAADNVPSPGDGIDGCKSCHPGFTGGPSAPLHNQHVNGHGITQCNLCHPSGAGTRPVRTYWSGPGGDYGCAGCHGHDYGEFNVTDLGSSELGEPKATAYGLRAVHETALGAGTCNTAGCHEPGALGHPMPFPPIMAESVAPPYYGLASNDLTDPCDSANEDLAFDADALGLDNDGDGLRDWPADPDCPMPPTTTTTLPPGSGSFGITGTKLVIVDKISAAGKAKVVYVAKDTLVDKGATNNLAQISATLEYQSPTLGASGSATMPQGAGWLVNKETVAKYVNKDAPGGAGAVKVTVIKPEKLLKAVLKGLGDAGSEIDIYGTGDPSPSSVDMTTRYTVVDGAATRVHCSEFTACARKIIAGGTGAKVVCKTATAGLSVTCPGSPSGAFLE